MNTQSEEYYRSVPHNILPDSYNGLEPDRIMFEKKLKFLVMLEHMGMCGMFGSRSQIENLSLDIFSRDSVSNRIESIEIVNDDLIQLVPKEKIFKVLSTDIFGEHNITNILSADIEYVENIKQFEHKIYHQVISEFTDKQKINAMLKLMNVYDFVRSDKFIELVYDIFIINGLNHIVSSSNNTIKIFNGNLEMICYNILRTMPNNNDIEIFDAIKMCKSMTNIELLDLLKMSRDKLEIIFTSFSDKHLLCEFIKKYKHFKFDENYSFIKLSNYLNSLDSNLIHHFVNILDDAREQVNGIKFNYIIKNHNIINKKYFDDYAKNKISLDTHYYLFKLNQKKYIELLKQNFLIDDYTFNSYILNDYSFVNKFNQEVKTYIINKIKHDTQRNIDSSRHTEISTLDNLIDIMYFIHNPPFILKKSDLKYYDKYIKLIDDCAKEFDFDFDKIIYKDMKVIFQYPILLQN